jgi:hypothetical protein
MRHELKPQTPIQRGRHTVTPWKLSEAQIDRLKETGGVLYIVEKDAISTKSVLIKSPFK